MTFRYDDVPLAARDAALARMKAEAAARVEMDRERAARDHNDMMIRREIHAKPQPAVTSRAVQARDAMIGRSIGRPYQSPPAPTPAEVAPSHAAYRMDGAMPARPAGVTSAAEAQGNRVNFSGGDEA